MPNGQASQYHNSSTLQILRLLVSLLGLKFGHKSWETITGDEFKEQPRARAQFKTLHWGHRVRKPKRINSDLEEKKVSDRGYLSKDLQENESMQGAVEGRHWIQTTLMNFQPPLPRLMGPNFPWSLLYLIQSLHSCPSVKLDPPQPLLTSGCQVSISQYKRQFFITHLGLDSWTRLLQLHYLSPPEHKSSFITTVS